jgi:hypothetical protein
MSWVEWKMKLWGDPKQQYFIGKKTKAKTKQNKQKTWMNNLFLKVLTESLWHFSNSEIMKSSLSSYNNLQLYSTISFSSKAHIILSTGYNCITVVTCTMRCLLNPLKWNEMQTLVAYDLVNGCVVC